MKSCIFYCCFYSLRFAFEDSETETLLTHCHSHGNPGIAIMLTATKFTTEKTCKMTMTNISSCRTLFLQSRNKDITYVVSKNVIAVNTAGVSSYFFCMPLLKFAFRFSWKEGKEWVIWWLNIKYIYIKIRKWNFVWLNWKC